MSAGHDGLKNSERQRRKQTPDEQVGGKHKNDAGLPHSSQIDKCDEHQDAQAQQQRVRKKVRKRGNECANSGRNPDSDGQDIVNHQRGRCK